MQSELAAVVGGAGAVYAGAAAGRGRALNYLAHYGVVSKHVLLDRDFYSVLGYEI